MMHALIRERQKAGNSESLARPYRPRRRMPGPCVRHFMTGALAVFGLASAPAAAQPGFGHPGGCALGLVDGEGGEGTPVGTGAGSALPDARSASLDGEFTNLADEASAAVAAPRLGCVPAVGAMSASSAGPSDSPRLHVRDGHVFRSLGRLRHSSSQTRSASLPTAQHRHSPRSESGVDDMGSTRYQFIPRLLVGIPRESFGENVGVSPGVAVDFTARAGRAPVFAGVAFDYLRYGSETRRVALYQAVPEVLTDVVTTNNFIRTHAVMRIQPRVGRLRPYAEGLAGFGYVWTETYIDLQREEDRVPTTKQLGSFAPSFGGGAGVSITLASDGSTHAGLEIGVRYLTGGDVEYLTRGDIRRDDTGVSFEPRRSRPKLLGLQIGLSLEF